MPSTAAGPVPLAVPSGPAVLDLLPAFAAALAGTTPLLPYAASGTTAAYPTGGAVPDGVGLVVGTSGSTGTPKLAMLTGAALRASGTATHEHLGGLGQWLLAMPATHVAGVQVLLRSLLAGTTPAVLDLTAGFTASGFAAAVATMTGPRCYSAVVPTQLSRLLADPAATEAAASLHGLLVGGAGTPPTLLAAARRAGIRAVTTYGMSETAGGCLYDGIPLSVSDVRLHHGRMVLGGETLALGYLGRPDLTARSFSTDTAGRRWFETDDAGHQDADGRWHVDGRLDDLIVTGGLKVAPRAVEEAVAQHLTGVLDCVVLGVPDPEWGQAVAAVVVLPPGTAAPTVAALRDLLRGSLPAHALPRHVLALDAIPVRGPGKPDRTALAALLAAGQ